MKVVIAKVHENLFNGDAEWVSVPTTEGVVTVLPKHEPFVGILKPGTVSIKTADKTHEFTVADGILEVSGNQATVLL